MFNVLETKDIRKLQEMGYYFIENTPHRSHWDNDGKNSRNNVIIDPTFYDSQKGTMSFSERTIRISRSSYHIRDNMKLGNVKCFKISSPNVTFMGKELKIQFEEFSYDQVIKILQREYALNDVLED